MLGLVAMTFASSAWAVTISTGAQPGWQVNSSAVVIESTIPTGIWIANFGDGVWVGPTATAGGILEGQGAPAGVYTYTLNIGALLGTSGNFTLQYAADNGVTWTINNGGTISGATVCASPDCFRASNGAPRSVSGTLTATSVLTATVTNDLLGGGINNPTGLLVVGTASNVPEPSTYAMLGLGGAALLLSRLRRK
jgi:hypothetical protein